MQRNIGPENIDLLRHYFILLFIYFLPAGLHAQLTISGTVLDNSKINYVEGVRVVSTGGGLAFTDSMGRYSIRTSRADSLFFMYNNKPTQKFAVAGINNQGQFDISLPVPVKSKYSVLKEVVVYSKTYKEDSAQNRDDYADIFSYRKPRIETSLSPGGGAGMDLDALINMFRFRHNKMMREFQQRLEEQEQDKYVDYRFSKKNVHRITQLQGAVLDTFLKWYRPTYDFTRRSDEVLFDQYVLNASYQFREIMGLGEMKKED